METSCFFCENLLSDYIEGVLPSVRHEQLRKHLVGCQTCQKLHDDLKTTLGLLELFPSRPLTHEMGLKIVEASEAGNTTKGWRLFFARVSAAVAVPVLLIALFALAFPDVLPLVGWFRNVNNESQFGRYYPLSQGAAEILDEQSTWLHAREPLMGSVWEEGGLSPEEFEKVFQVKPSVKQDSR
ncbi:MAG: zf-HC2 domain-containing protein [Deltaproteobacteria bacterium]|nr:zf-HC2 domain-containing protein [Deltaproteobacteria bacterium]